MSAEVPPGATKSAGYGAGAVPTDKLSFGEVETGHRWPGWVEDFAARHTLLFQATVTVIAVALGLAVAAVLPYRDYPVLVPLAIAAVAVSWVAGLAAGVLAVLLCTLGALLFLPLPIRALSLSNLQPAVRFLVSEGAMLFFVWMVWRLRSSEAQNFLRRRQERQSAEMLAAINSHLTLALGVGLAGTFDWYPDTKTVVWSPELMRLYGFEPSAFPGIVEGWREAILPEDCANAEADLKGCLLTGELDTEWRIRRRDDGRIRWISARGRVFYDEERKPVRVTGINSDITERKQAEEAIRESELRFRTVTENIPQMVWTCDSQGRCDYLSARWMEYTGTRLEENLGLGWQQRIHPDDRPRVSHAWDDATQGRGVYSVEYRLRGADGLYRWHLARGVPILEYSGTVVRWFGTTTDIEQVKQAETALRDSEQRLQTALDAAKLGAWSHNLITGEIVADDRAKAIFGLPPDEKPTYEKLLALMTPEDRVPFEATLASPGGLDKINVDYRILLPNGDIRWIHARGSTVCDELGKPIRRTGVILDNTEQKRAEQEMRSLEEQFRHAQKMEAVGRLAGGIAHDFNNLLQVINSYAFLLGESTHDDGLRRKAQAIVQAGQRAADLTAQLLAFSRKRPAEPNVVNMDHAILGMEKIVRPLVGEDVEVRALPNASGACVKIDPSQLEQVIMNLVVNARDAMPRGGRLTIETRSVEVQETYAKKLGNVAPGVYVELSVSDTGSGMDARTRERIFEPFFTTKAPGKGTGLGLSIVYGIVTQHGGRIHVQSELGRGTTFRTYLPTFSDATPGLRVAKPEVVTTGTGTVLLVEDEEDVRDLIRNLLEDLGYRVLQAVDGKEALELAQRRLAEIDIVVCDTVMPRMGGLELRRRLLMIRPELKVLLISGYTGGVVEDTDLAEVEFLAKPFTFGALAAKLRQMLQPGHHPSDAASRSSSILQ